AQLLEGGTRSLISAPLVASGTTIGLLCVASPAANGFDADHTQIVSEVANQLAVAIHQTSLRAALDRQQARLQAVVQHLPEGVLLLERDGRVAIANAFGHAHLATIGALSPAGEVTTVGDLTLARQILDFSRQSSPALETVDLAALLEQTVALLRRTLPETIRIVVEPVEARFVVNVDPNQLSQVLTNLAVNARDAMALGGELRFRLGREERGETEGESAPGPGAWTTLAVSDTGPGIPADVRERIFEPFFTTKAPGSGTGLGLSQAYGIVTQHRGHIAVDSRP